METHDQQNEYLKWVTGPGIGKNCCGLSNKLNTWILCEIQRWKQS
jgi:hypothetical protein